LILITDASALAIETLIKPLAIITTMQNKNKVVVWPVYLDSKTSRTSGRKLPKRHSVESPTIHEIERASNTLSLNPMVEADKIYPGNRNWWEGKGRVIVDKSGRKIDVLLSIAKRVKEFRISK